MTDTANSALTPAAPPADTGIGQRALGGTLWAAGQTVGSKLAVLVQQYLLAVLLLEEDFAPTAIAGFILGFAAFGQQLGVIEILVRRHRKFAVWANIAFWLNLTAGLGGMLLVLAVAPLASLTFHMPILTSFLAIGAVAIPLDALAAVPQAKLTHEMRFRTLALLGSCNVFATVLLTVLFAWRHFGAYSLILPKPIVSAVLAIAYFSAARVRLRLRPHFHRWKLVFQDSRYFLVMNIFSTFLTAGDYLTCGLFFSKPILGSYYFAYNASTQTNQLVAANLASVLLPSFTKMRDFKRQVDAYARVCGLISFVGTPMCLLQATCAAPLFHLVLKHKWDTALPLFAILSIGMLFVLPSGPTVSMLKAQGRYSLLMKWTCIVSVGFIVSVVCGALLGSIRTVAMAVALFYTVAGPAGFMLPMLGLADKWAHLWRVYGAPLLVGLVAAAAGVAASWPITGDSPAVLAATLAIRGSVTCAVYAVLGRFLLRQHFKEMMNTGKLLFSKISGRRSNRLAPSAGSAS